MEGSKASVERLTRLVLLIAIGRSPVRYRAIAYTTAALQGLKIKQLGQQKYIHRLQEEMRSPRRHSHFWTGQYGLLWIVGMEFWADEALELMRIRAISYLFFRGVKLL